METMADRIKKRRIELGMSQDELAKKVGYTDRSAIAKIEAGRIDLPQSKIVEFANVFGVDAGDLLGWGEDLSLLDLNIETAKSAQNVQKIAFILLFFSNKKRSATEVTLPNVYKHHLTIYTLFF